VDEMSVPVDRKWRVYIGGVEYTYSNIDFTETHPSPYPDTFTIVLNGQHIIPYFSEVIITRDMITKFYGYVEKRRWTSEVDTEIWGRCRKLIVWKKWMERFVEAREGGNIAGFFGVMCPAEIFKFLLRCPISDVAPEDEEWRNYPLV